jgi:hypothetical protein
MLCWHDRRIRPTMRAAFTERNPEDPRDGKTGSDLQVATKALPRKIGSGRPELPGVEP